jgi:hypothetical protein
MARLLCWRALLSHDGAALIKRGARRSGEGVAPTLFLD